MAGISHQNLNWLLQAYCQGLLLHIKEGGHWVQLVFKQFYTWVQNGKKTQFNKGFLFLIGGAREVQEWGMIRDRWEQQQFWDGWGSELTLIWGLALTNVTYLHAGVQGAFRWMNRWQKMDLPCCFVEKVGASAEETERLSAIAWFL